MCGIAAISLSKNSKINARQLSNALFRGLEQRGYMSAGYAYSSGNENVGYYKRPGLATQLTLRHMPKRPSNVILHTRFATQGSIEDNTNNHPVMSPDNNIALVHNGVIWNDSGIRRTLDNQDKIAVVDTAVIPALLEQKGVAGLKELVGDAAIAWLDVRDSERLHVARIESSPMHVTWLKDGSFVMASTHAILAEALDSLSLEHTGIIQVDELDYMILQDGKIVEESKLEKNEYHGYGYASASRGATSGGGYGGSSTKSPVLTSSRYVGESFWDDVDWDYSDLDSPAARAAVLDDSLVANANIYYTYSHWGDYVTYPNLNSMILALDSYKYLNLEDEERIHAVDDEALNFIERIADIGFIDEDGTDTSFVNEPREMDEHEIPMFVRDGVSEMKKFWAKA